MFEKIIEPKGKMSRDHEKSNGSDSLHERMNKSLIFKTLGKHRVHEIFSLLNVPNPMEIPFNEVLLRAESEGWTRSMPLNYAVLELELDADELLSEYHPRDKDRDYFIRGIYNLITEYRFLKTKEQ